MGYEPTIAILERPKTVSTLKRAVTLSDKQKYIQRLTNTLIRSWKEITKQAQNNIKNGA
jgi:hypothetical protein